MTLRLLQKGHDAKSIARELGLSVHTVNERLRAARRKLGVSSSREAARNLAADEEKDPNTTVHKEIGVDGHDVGVDSGRGAVAHKYSRSHLALAIGGTLVMSLILAIAILPSLTSTASSSVPMPNWSTATNAPNGGTPVNKLYLDGSQMIWNGEPVSEASVRDFLQMVSQLEPQPMVILNYSKQTPTERRQRARELIDNAIRCSPNLCLEITEPQ